MISRYRKSLMFFLLFLFSQVTFAQDLRPLSRNGLKGQELVSLAVSPQNSDTMYVGTSKGMYQYKNGVQGGFWESLCSGPLEDARINQILISPQETGVYLATGKGLYVFDPKKKVCKNVFSKNDVLERDCTTVSLLSNDVIFLGTAGGLFLKKRQEAEWSKIAAPFGAKKIISLYGRASVVYAAIDSAVYKSEDSGRNWQKIFDLYSDSPMPEDAEEGQPAVKYILGDLGDPNLLYVATGKGIFLTKDSGKTWNQLPSAGLDTVQLKSLLVIYPDKKVFAITKTGIYRLKDGAWRMSAAAYDCRQAVQMGASLILVTGRDIFEYISSTGSDSLNHEGLDQEPTIEEVQAMAIRYCDLSAEKIKDWRRKASIRAFMPEVSVDFDKTITTALGASYDRIQLGPTDWGVSLKWDLADLVYNPEQTSIDVRSKLMVELRNDVLSEVTRLYFERRKLQTELASLKDDNSQGLLDKKLRLMELTALIDRFTGGYFSKVLKSR